MPRVLPKIYDGPPRGECQGFSLKSMMIHPLWMPRVLPKIYDGPPRGDDPPPVDAKGSP